MKRLKRRTYTLLSFALASSALGFCGFFVAKGDTKLFNRSNQVVIARDGKRSVFTMMNDYQGDAKDFARIVPIPVVPKREDLSIGDPSIIKKLDAYSAPRLVEYFDEDPCAPPPVMMDAVPAPSAAPMQKSEARANALGVKIEASYQVGEYDIVILSAKQQDGLATYLRGEGYKLPAGADEMLGGYIKGGMKFFVVRVNMERFDKSGGGFLNPIVLSYTSDKFMLPIRLGTLNSPGEQDLTVYLLSPYGRVETSNYRTAPIPTDKEVPMLVQDQFGSFYRHVFRKAYEREGKSVAFMEYAWNTNNCDPCAGEPPTAAELKKAGVFWEQQQGFGGRSVPLPPPGQGSIRPSGNGEAKPVFLTRLHVRYTRATFPEDLQFKLTDNQDTFQGRYILRHPAESGKTCAASKSYTASLKRRAELQAQTLANLTGWDINHIRQRMAE
ncbi:DUF2330 domain-containing protein [Deinococcus psychrotolerans]|uniref:DUF2330 domain-containing protein n=1 Tax=Deinococcus psychrotolerans TaxID=2489213 RepID=A0A3G8YIS5_9DEIO|nr:DUF2330 domain-containing protein [Deinococcus psychrotolerans]AZI42444.1 DUF2330 domain-containing protein [Deinococcus psychrotolerans]